MPKLLFVLSFIILFAKPGYAAGLQLTRIGSMDTTGGFYRQWWYTGTNPSLQGLAQPNSSVTVSVDGVSNSVTADTSGYWIYSGDGLDAGDHEVNIADGAETLAFTLHAGQDMDNTETVTATTSEGEEVEMPVSGNGLLTSLLAVCGISTLYLGIKLRSRLSLLKA